MARNWKTAIFSAFALLPIALCSTITVPASDSPSTVHAAVEDDASKTYCLLLDSDISGTVHYFNVYKNETVAYEFVVNGSFVNTSGKCHKFDPKANGTLEELSIRFIPDGLDIPSTEAQFLWKITLEFVAAKEQTFTIKDYELEAYFYQQLNASRKPSQKVIYGMANGSELEWGASETHGYTCSKSALPLVRDSSIQFAGLKVLAFAKAENSTFPEGQLFEQCKYDVRTSDLIPIIVGACLAGLVIIVLIAYLIGRARAKRQGYASV